MQSAAMTPLFNELCTPLIFITFNSPAESPNRIPPLKYNYGIEKYPPAEITLAPYLIHFPSSKCAFT